MFETKDTLFSVRNVVTSRPLEPSEILLWKKVYEVSVYYCLF